MSESSAFQQLALQFLDPIQHDYEAIRPLLFGDVTLSQRSDETSAYWPMNNSGTETVSSQ